MRQRYKKLASLCRRSLLSLVAISSILACNTALAIGGGYVTLPTAGVINKSGLQITLDGRGVDGNGYRPIRISVRPVPFVPQAADRQIRIVLKPIEYSSVGSAEVSQVIELPEGSTVVEATILVPQSALWSQAEMTTYEGGEEWKELSAPYLGWPNNSGYWDWTEARPSIWVLDRDAKPRGDREDAIASFRATGADPNPTNNLPDVRTLGWMFQGPNAAAPMPPGMAASTAAARSATVSDVGMLSQLRELSRIEIVSLGEVPARWVEMSQVDVALVSLDDLEHLAIEHPQSAAGLRNWLATGPLLVVYGVGEEFERLADLERLLELPALPFASDESASYRGWTTPSEADNTGSLKTSWDVTWQSTVAATSDLADTNEASQSQSATSSTSGSAAPPFLQRPAHLGCVVAIGAEHPFPGTEKEWSWLFNSVNDSHWQWYQRNGFSLHRRNDDYWMFLIPGVGEAPVVSFLLLVSLFAVVIGPINYIFLGRMRRLYLLLITVPVGAAVVTACLFGYALLTDGLGVRLRARSFTELDQRTGRAAAWSRQSYYAAMSPSEGLVFPEDATVFPLVYQPAMQLDKTIGHLEWDGEQRLKAGYLPSRTASQFVVQRATRTSAKLLVREGPTQPPNVENQLETTILYLLLCGKTGAYFDASDIAHGGRATLRNTTAGEAEKRMRALFGEVEPALPRGYDPNLHNNFFTTIMRSYAWMSVDAASTAPAMAVSILESNLAIASLPTKNPLGNGTYVAIVEASPVVPSGVPQAREEASLHVIRGRW